MRGAINRDARRAPARALGGVPHGGADVHRPPPARAEGPPPGDLNVTL